MPVIPMPKINKQLLFQLLPCFILIASLSIGIIAAVKMHDLQETERFSRATLQKLAAMTKRDQSTEESEVVKLLGNPDYTCLAGHCSQFGRLLVWRLSSHKNLVCHCNQVVHIPGFPSYVFSCKVEPADQEER